DILSAAVKSDSPDDILRDAALGSFGPLGDSRAVATLMEWSAAGKPVNSREEAISALAELDKKDATITETLVSYLHDTHFDLTLAAVLALAVRGDPSAIAPLEQLRTSGDLTMGQVPHIDTALSLLKARAATK